MKPLLSKYEFNGYDWVELSEALGLDVKADKYVDRENEEFGAGDKRLADDTYSILVRHLTPVDGFDSDEYRNTIHNFLDKLIVEEEQWGSCAGIYREIRKIECDYTLAQWIGHTLPLMWT